jgi:hypothetical protein
MKRGPLRRVRTKIPTAGAQLIELVDRLCCGKAVRVFQLSNSRIYGLRVAGSRAGGERTKERASDNQGAFWGWFSLDPPIKRADVICPNAPSTWALGQFEAQCPLWVQKPPSRNVCITSVLPLIAGVRRTGLDVEFCARGDIDRTSSARASKVGGTALALRHDTHFMAAKVSTTLRLLTPIMPMPG